MAGDVVWLRRDLRRADLPTLGAAHLAGGPVTVTFVVDPQFWDTSGPARRAWLARTLLATRGAYDGHLTLLLGDPRERVLDLADQVGAAAVHVSAETEPTGAARDAAVSAALAARGVDWVITGSPYAVMPGRVRRGDGEPYRVFTPFSRAWFDHGWRLPAQEPDGITFGPDRSDPDAWAMVEKAAAATTVRLPDAGEAAATARWREFLGAGLAGYASERDRPDLDGTSRLSPYLKFGVIHPRTLLADLASHDSRNAHRFRNELAWRDFYADVLHHNPHTEWEDLNPAMARMEYDDNPERVEAWKAGRTGFPIVDAGMRQLLGSGWVHNRVRMIVASFLVKHLHTRWQVGAQHYLDHLIDADIASNQHGWQWVAGTGTDAAPYFRVFNPVLQGQKFDPDGAYVRRWVPELADIDGAAVHTPWRLPAARRRDYPDPVVDLAAERADALARLDAAKTPK